MSVCGNSENVAASRSDTVVVNICEVGVVNLSTVKCVEMKLLNFMVKYVL